MIRARVRCISIVAKSAACRTHHSTCAAIFVITTTAVTAAALPWAASSTTKAMEAARQVLEHLDSLAYACAMEGLSITPRTAKCTLLRVLLPLHQNKRHQKKRRPSDTHFCSTGLDLALQ